MTQKAARGGLLEGDRIWRTSGRRSRTGVNQRRAGAPTALFSRAASGAVLRAPQRCASTAHTIN
ncbi:hypothetical protein BG60_12435 [Caballeronia zhejiangensis]|uniref:Uncharacterized protein n=1 Tax=Caballeronia zhejiangensis TaxID=871203 RepID=A0A656QMY7_9BURK|nr:hypothetical protein BG60_12435 [Caballeronia zhejiangensis]